jgi:hypothetical protein
VRAHSLRQSPLTLSNESVSQVSPAQDRTVRTVLSLVWDRPEMEDTEPCASAPSSPHEMSLAFCHGHWGGQVDMEKPSLSQVWSPVDGDG